MRYSFFKYCLLPASFLLCALLPSACGKSSSEPEDDGTCTRGAAKLCFCEDGVSGIEFCLGSDKWSQCNCSSPASAESSQKLYKLLASDQDEEWKNLLKKPEDPEQICRYSKTLQYRNHDCLLYDTYAHLLTTDYETASCAAKARIYVREDSDNCSSTDVSSVRSEKQQALKLALSPIETRKAKFKDVWNVLMDEPGFNPPLLCPYIEGLFITQEDPCLVYDIYSIIENNEIELNCTDSADAYLNQFSYCTQSDTNKRKFYRSRIMRKIKPNDPTIDEELILFEDIDENDTTEVPAPQEPAPQPTKAHEKSQPVRDNTPAAKTPAEKPAPEKLTKEQASALLSNARKEHKGKECQRIANMFPDDTNLQCRAFECLKKDPAFSKCEVFRFSQNLRKKGGGFCLEQIQAYMKENSICWNQK